MKNVFIKLLPLLLGSGLFLSSCTKEDDWQKELIFNVSINQPYISSSGGMLLIDVEANCQWNLERIQLSTDPTNNYSLQESKRGGFGDAQISILVPVSTYTSDRTWIIYFSYKASNDGREGENILMITQFAASGNTGGGNTGGGNTGGGNTGGGNTGGGNTGGGNTGGGNTTTKPSAPTNVYAENYGNATIPDVRISWASVTGATKYYVYRSTSANGSYSQLGSTTYTFYSDSNVEVGKTYYYKVRASNSAGMSDYSPYAVFEFKDTRKPGPAQYGNCSVSGTTMTLRWSVPTNASYGKPTKALLKVRNPESDEYVILKELPGTTTTVSFNYKPWVHTSGYLAGYVYVGIILENEYGSGGGSAKVWDDKNKKWIN